MDDDNPVGDPDAAPADPDAVPAEGDAEDDLELQWDRIRAANDAEFEGFVHRDNALRVAPVLLLYSGFFFGPWSTALLAAYIVRWKLSARDCALLVGWAGAGWCIVVATVVNTWGRVDPITLHVTRASLNFVIGLFFYLWVRKRVVGTAAYTRGTIVRTGVGLVVAATAFYFAPTMLLFYLGR